MICLDPALQPQQYKAQAWKAAGHCSSLSRVAVLEVVSHLEPSEERRVWARSLAEPWWSALSL